MIFHITNMERDVATGGILTAHYTVTLIDGLDDKYSASQYGSVGFKPNPQDDDFIPYEDLTEDQVIVWVKEALGREEMEAIEANLLRQIEEQKTPKVADGLPWA